jgi:hypothetical protein
MLSITLSFSPRSGRGLGLLCQRPPGSRCRGDRNKAWRYQYLTEGQVWDERRSTNQQHRLPTYCGGAWTALGLATFSGALASPC